LAWHDALACDFFSRKQAMTLSMLTRDELHSLNTSGMHVAWSVAEGLNSAKAEVVEDAKRAKLTAAITFFLMVFMTFPRSLNGSLASAVGGVMN
jgi:hypothetical protein